MLMHEKFPSEISIYQAKLKGTQWRSLLPCCLLPCTSVVLSSGVIKKTVFSFRCHRTDNLQQGEARKDMGAALH